MPVSCLLIYNVIVVALRSRLKSLAGDADAETPARFVYRLTEECAVDKRALTFTYSRLNSLLRTLEITGLDEFNALQVSFIHFFCSVFPCWLLAHHVSTFNIFGKRPVWCCALLLCLL